MTTLSNYVFVDLDGDVISVYDLEDMTAPRMFRRQDFDTVEEWKRAAERLGEARAKQLKCTWGANYSA